MKVNVVMLVKGRDRLTAQALYTLLRNTNPDLYNLTIVEEGGKSIQAGPEHCIWLQVNPEVNITGRLRNLGVYWAEKHWGHGDYLYLSDNDVYFTPGWLEKMLDVMERFDPDLLGGWNHPFLQPREKIPAHIVNDRTFLHTHDAVTGASQLMKWDVWDDHGPLDAHAEGVGQSEDWAFCQKIWKAGGIVESIYPRVVLNCGITNSYGQLSPGAEQMRDELTKAKAQYPNLYWE